jgi:putative spermidine/putrescine transport system permease protein
MNRAANTTLSEQIAGIAVRCLTALVLVFLVAPIIVVIPLSFNADSYFSYPMRGFSLQWYESVLSSPLWHRAILNSLLIGFFSTLLAMVLGTLAALGLSRPTFPLRSLIVPLLLSPMIIPIVVVAVGLYAVFAPLGLTGTYLGVVLAHTALGTPFVVITVTATFASFDRNLTRAASGLGANHLTVFRRITLPLILPGILTGGIFAFATSFDEIVVILFIGSVDQRTIPREMWAGIRDQISPAILAVATFLTCLAIGLYLIVGWVRARSTSLVLPIAEE